MKIKEKAVVAMSGGVDSSVAAILMKEAGYDVIGISMKLWDYPEAEKRVSAKTCCASEDIGDARSVAARIGIPFYAVNYTETFEEKVITPFVTDYLNGKTPNPCILCNQHIKFDYLLERSRALGAEILATGHFARIEQNTDGCYRLLRGKDPSKDQSYFLFNLGQEELARIRFPLGHLTKTEVRKIAREYGLCTAEKSESQEICFVGNDSPAHFVRDWKQSHALPLPLPKPGAFVKADGEILGTHEGIDSYTVGQRRGLHLGGQDERHYVTRIDREKNTVTLGTYEEGFVRGLEAERVHWVREPVSGRCEAKIRYRHSPIAAELTPLANDRIRLSFLERERSIAPGQAVVFYNGDDVLGGAWIRTSFS